MGVDVVTDKLGMGNMTGRKLALGFKDAIVGSNGRIWQAKGRLGNYMCTRKSQVPPDFRIYSFRLSNYNQPLVTTKQNADFHMTVTCFKPQCLSHQ